MNSSKTAVKFEASRESYLKEHFIRFDPLITFNLLATGGNEEEIAKEPAYC